MPNSLLQRQADLIAYLTSETAIFGGRGGGTVPDLHGLDPRQLRLEARFSHEKRMQKIVTVLPRTFGMLGRRRVRLVRDFVRACPPQDVGRLANARQFHDFLLASWDHGRDKPHYLPDVAACELAYASVRIADERPGTTAAPGASGHIRRSPGVVLLRCAYDVRAVFEPGADRPAPVRRDTWLAVGKPSGDGSSGIYALHPAVYDLLAELDDWSELASFGEDPAVAGLIDDLTAHRLIEHSA